MSHYDLIAFDMDGTLLNSNKELLDETVEAIEEAVSAGKIVVISTGRCVGELTPYLNRLKDIRYLITISGAFVYDNVKRMPVFEKPLPPETVSNMLSISESYDQLTQLMSEKPIIQYDKYSNIDNYHMRQYHSLYTATAVITENLSSYYHNHQPRVYKFNMFHKNITDREAMFRRFAHFDTTIVFSEETGLECTVKGISKATGLRALCEAIGVPIERTIAVGDADNDLEIIRAAGLGIAMGNANDNVRSAANVVVADCDHNGCAQAIRDYLLS